MIKKLFLVLISVWLGWTIIIDFIVVPSVFSTIHDFFNAGELGIKLFSKLNNFELILSTALIIVSLRLKKLDLLLVVCCFAIVVIYFSYLTPKLVHFTELWKKADLAKQIGIAGYADIQQEHQRFHRYYVTLDSLKIFMLGTLLVRDIFIKEKAT